MWLNTTWELIPVMVETKCELSDFEYTRCNIPGPGANVKDFCVKYRGCACTDEVCSPPTCQCLKMNEQQANYDQSGSLLPLDLGDNISKPILECNDSCQCSSKCFNRQTQRGIKFPLCVFQTGRKGFGLKTIQQKIPKGRFVCEYAGEILDCTEAEERAKSLKQNDKNYLLVVLEHLTGNKTLKTYVDPKWKGNLGRFINHSCQPNLLMTPVRVNGPIPKICLFANRDIFPEEELTFDYSGGLGECEITEGKRNYNFERKPCYCQSENCTGFLPFSPFLYDS